MQAHWEFIFKRRAARVITVPDSCDDREYPVGGENVQLVVAHSVKIIVRILPRQVTLLVIHEVTRSDIEPGHAEVVEQNEDLAEHTEGILNIVFLTLTFVLFDNIHDLCNQVVELVDLVDADNF